MMPGSPSIAARAAYTLRDNSTGLITKAAPALYPHQWSWDAAFNAIGLATVDLPRARLELDSLFAGQWRNGLLPHIVFDPTAAADGYWPGPAQWECSLHNEDASSFPATSGIIDPPVHAIAVDRILSIATACGGREAELTRAWAAGIYPKLLAWHRFLARDRTDKSTGLMTLFHGWESGTDNSPRWDAPYAGVEVGVGSARPTPGATRRTCRTPASGRPTTSTTGTCGWSRRPRRPATTPGCSARPARSRSATCCSPLSSPPPLTCFPRWRSSLRQAR